MQRKRVRAGQPTKDPKYSPLSRTRRSAELSHPMVAKSVEYQRRQRHVTTTPVTLSANWKRQWLLLLILSSFYTEASGEMNPGFSVVVNSTSLDSLLDILPTAPVTVPLTETHQTLCKSIEAKARQVIKLSEGVANMENCVAHLLAAATTSESAASAIKQTLSSKAVSITCATSKEQRKVSRRKINFFHKKNAEDYTTAKIFIACDELPEMPYTLETFYSTAAFAEDPTVTADTVCLTPWQVLAAMPDGAPLPSTIAAFEAALTAGDENVKTFMWLQTKKDNRWTLSVEEMGQYETGKRALINALSPINGAGAQELAMRDITGARSRYLHALTHGEYKSAFERIIARYAIIFSCFRTDELRRAFYSDAMDTLDALTQCSLKDTAQLPLADLLKRKTIVSAGVPEKEAPECNKLIQGIVDITTANPASAQYISDVIRKDPTFKLACSNKEEFEALGEENTPGFLDITSRGSTTIVLMHDKPLEERTVREQFIYAMWRLLHASPQCKTPDEDDRSLAPVYPVTEENIHAYMVLLAQGDRQVYDLLKYIGAVNKGLSIKMEEIADVVGLEQCRAAVARFYLSQPEGKREGVYLTLFGGLVNEQHSQIKYKSLSQKAAAMDAHRYAMLPKGIREACYSEATNARDTFINFCSI